MDLNRFADIIAGKVQEKAGSGYRVERMPVRRNNQVVETGIGISSGADPFLTVAGIEPYYIQYMCGNMDMEVAVEDILRVLGPGDGGRESGAAGLYDYGKVKDRIIFRLVSRDIPHIPFLDMAVEFRILVEENEWGQKTVPVDSGLCRMWQKEPQDLMDQAARNMPLLCPPVMVPVQERMMEILETYPVGEDLKKELYRQLGAAGGKIPLYILSNRREIQGASAIPYPGVLGKYADILESDLVILPSSVHEVLLVPYGEKTSFSFLWGMVQQVNASDVPPEERLSDQVYLYRRASGRITVAGESAD